MFNVNNIDSYENQKVIQTISHYCRLDSKKSNEQPEIFVNNKSVMKIEDDTQEDLYTKPANIVKIGILQSSIMNNRVF